MRDLVFLIVVLAVAEGVSFVSAWKLAARVPPMSRRRIILLAPLPLPAILIGLCLYILVDAYSASAEECGVDACGMAAAAGMMGISLALLLYGVGMGAAALGIRAARS